ncbi:MAG: 30S ribosome-binding factor RbfA [Flavobacteriaceae bacterium]|jgi:ribosome-binding factor A|nr:30S ribosome-binding factor RbfA [Flavobacteriia bacterium]
MEKQESSRQKKIGTVLQQEIATLLQQAIRQGGGAQLMLSVTKVTVTSDLSLAKVYLSIFPSQKAQPYFEALKQNGSQLRHDLSQRMKNQLRKIPELVFYLDDSLDYIEGIENELDKGENPIKNPTLLNSRQRK